MKDFNFEDYEGRGRRSSRRPSRNDSGRKSPNRRNSDKFSSRKNFRQRNSEHQDKHTATCDACGKRCEVPFRPAAGKPIYCEDCFRSNKSLISENKNHSSSKGLDEINKKLDKILFLLGEN
ncbi:hypothetical protein HYT56_03655 [Candidatus Woesearchaeota archaeon]|nr:hypothetical protein [Candidatus Woesearchaeota archaeon]